MAKQPFKGDFTNMRQKRGFFGSYTDGTVPPDAEEEAMPNTTAMQLPGLSQALAMMNFTGAAGTSWHPPMVGYGWPTLSSMENSQLARALLAQGQGR